MRIRRRITLALTVTAALAWPVAGASAAPAAAYTVLPAHVYAPYYETYLAPNTPSLTATAQASGAKYFTLAFLQSAGKNSCSLEWNGNAGQPTCARGSPRMPGTSATCSSRSPDRGTTGEPVASREATGDAT
jgi:hypothetical protein